MKCAFNKRGRRIKRQAFELAAWIGLLVGAGEILGADLVLTSIDRPGRVAWSCPSLNVTCRVEWAAAAAGPWHSSWADQRTAYVTNPSNETEVAMFYRVVCEIPDPHFPDITADQSLALIAHRENDPDFVIVDVRTPSEYGTRHIIGTLNIDYYAATFASQLDALDKNKAYLIYCASGNRSGNAHDTMLGLGFHEVYNMLGGMGAFQGVPGADAYLEPSD